MNLAPKEFTPCKISHICRCAVNYFIKWQKWANQFPEVNATPAEEIYVALYMLSLFQNNKSYPVIRMSHYAIKHFNEFFTGGRELGSYFITKVLQGIKRLSKWLHRESEKSSLLFRSEKSFSISGWCRNESYKFETSDDDTRPFLYGFS